MNTGAKGSCLYYSASDWLFKLTEATMGTNVFGYVYDPIGNRKTADRDQQTTHYTANELNQYLSITSASSVVSLSYDPDEDAEGSSLHISQMKDCWR